MDYKFEKKFSEKHIDNFISEVHNNIEINPNDSYYFDMIETEWISNQELLVFTALLYHFREKKINYKIDFFTKGVFPANNRRKALLLISLWDNWKIYEIVPEYKYKEYFGFTESLITSLKKEYDIELLRHEIYDKSNIVTPFQQLPFLSKYTDRDIIQYLNKYNSIESATKQIIKLEGLSHPFLNNSFGAIIVKELYENFLDHFFPKLFNIQDQYAFFSLSVKSKIKDPKLSIDAVDYILEKNFKEEKLLSTKPFFYNERKKRYKNQSFLEFSFLDFGKGIVETIRSSYSKKASDSDILKYAFEPTSSRNPINKKHFTDNNIPRGLFDLISVVERYEGLLIARSNYGKVIFNFSDNKNFEDSVIVPTKDNKTFFPGTLISIYIPTLNNTENFNSTRINPPINFSQIKALKVDYEHYINLYPIFDKIEGKDLGKPKSYQLLIKYLSKEIKSQHSTINYINFKGCQKIDERLLKKAIFYLLTDYKINLSNNVIILNPPSNIFIENIKNEILSLNEAVKDFVIQPIPLVYLENNEITLKWLGISNQEDEDKLKDLLFGDFNHSLVKGDFIKSSEIVGQLNYFDPSGNLRSVLPSEDELISRLLKDLIEGKDCVKTEGLYLCSGNYYQEKYLQLSNILSDKEDCDLVVNLLYNRIKQKCLDKKVDLDTCIFIGVTSSSGKILQEFLRNNTDINEDQIQFIESYSFFNEEVHSKFKKDKNYILVCDTISTGYLTERIDRIIEDCGSRLIVISVLTNLLDEKFENTNKFIDKYSNRLISLVSLDIKKYRRKDLSNIQKKKLQNIIRINPYTNTPITFTLKDTNYEKVLINNNQFLDILENEDINIGFKNFNNLIHPYFFDIKKIIAKENLKLESPERLNDSILKKSFDKIQFKSKSNIKIFYPKSSDIRYLNLESFKFNILKNNTIEYFELERFPTMNGWKFPHISNYYELIVKDSDVLLLDDGSCSGDSLLQMINEVSYFKPKTIQLVSIIGRVDGHKREFFSKINSISESNTPINVCFSSYWNIPTFHLYKNPYSTEIIWLEKLLAITNTPSFVEKTAKNILNQIKPNNNKSFKDYDYLIPKRSWVSKADKFPKKEMTNVRDKIGQVVGYRYYKESFEWFNYLISTLEDKSITDAQKKYKNIEIVSMCILFEPYLYDELVKVMPDFRDKMELFVQALIFGNPERELKKIDLNKHLFYDWTRCKKDIIHLFFIVFKNEKLISFLDKSKVKNLFDFANNENNLHYFLYKISFYFINPYSDRIISILHVTLKGLSEDQKYNKLMGNFMSFTRTLPNKNENLHSQINTLKNLYHTHVVAETTHNEKNSFTHNISEIYTMLDEISHSIYNDGLIRKEIIPSIFGLWMRNQLFLENIISFTRGFKEYFLPNSESYIDRILGKDNSLTLYILKIEDFLKHELDYWNQGNRSIDNKEYLLSMIDEIKKYFKLIEDDFISENSDFYKLVNQETVSIDYIIRSLNDILNKEFKYNGLAANESYKSCHLPLLYYNKTILREIINNLKRHGQPNDLNLECKFSLGKEELRIDIKNKINPEINKNSTSQGLKLIKMLSDSEFFDFNYIRDEKEGVFSQSLIFIYL